MKNSCNDVSNKKVILSVAATACQSEYNSSESSLSLDSRSSSLRTSSSSSSSVSTHLEIYHKFLFGSCKSMDANASNSTETPEISAAGAATPEVQKATVKQYRNSPFGLTHHYLTMPDNNEKSNDLYKDAMAIKYTTDEEEDLAEDEGDSELELGVNRLKIDKTTTQQPLYLSHSKSSKAQVANNHQLLCDSSGSQHSISTTLSPNSNRQNWTYQHHQLNQPKQLDPIGSLNFEHSHHTRRHCDSPNGEEDGDDFAEAKCDTKEPYRHCRMNSTNQHATHIPNDLRKLKIDELAKPREESNSLLVRFSSIMYATFLVILGCILHVSELRQKSKNSSDHIYTTIVALLGIIWLLFLQMDLQRYKRYASKYILIETIFNDQRQKSIDEELRSKELDPTARSTSSSSASLVNDRMSMNTEVIFKKTAYKMYQQRISMDRHNMNHGNARTSANFLNHHESHKNSHSEDQYAADDDLVPAYKFLHGKMGANFYLKCGMAAFCFGHVIHEGLRFGQQVYFFGTGSTHCKDSAALVAHLVTPLYSFYQLFMMFKYSNLVINRHKILAQFGLMHIIGTSVTFWFRTILEEAFEDFVHKMDYFKTNRPQLNLTFGGIHPSESNLLNILTSITNTIKPSEISSNQLESGWSVSNANNLSLSTASTTAVATTSLSNMAQSLLTLMSSPISATITPQIVRHLPDSYACAQNTLLTTKSMNALPYLYPFTIEYNLLLAATFLSLYFNIGKVGRPTGVGNCRPSALNYIHMHQKHRAANGSIGSNMDSSDNSSAIKMRDSMEKDYIGEYKSNFVVNADCHSANKGLFCGFFVLLVTLVTIVIFFVTINKPTHIQLGIKINLIQEATLTALILIVTLAGFKQVVKLNRNRYLRDKVTTDDVLMLIPLPFFFIHSLLSFRAETALMSSNGMTSFSSSLLQRNNNAQQQDSMATTKNERSNLLSTNNNSPQLDSRSRLNNSLAVHLNGTNGRLVETLISNINNNRSGRFMGTDNSNSNNIGNIINSNDVTDGEGSKINNNNNSSQMDHFKLITVALNIIVMIEVLVQTNFIIDGMRRCSESRYLRFKKPGRELITFAIILNITYWIVATFETKSVEQYKTEIEYYGPLPYMFISHTTLPVMLFYRYHSSVCLAEIWNRAYKPPKKR